MSLRWRGRAFRRGFPWSSRAVCGPARRLCCPAERPRSGRCPCCRSSDSSLIESAGSPVWEDNAWAARRGPRGPPAPERPAPARPNNALRLRLDALEQLDVLLDVPARQLGDVHGLAVAAAALDEVFLDLKQLAVALELALIVLLVEGRAGRLLELLHHLAVLGVHLRHVGAARASAGAARCVGGASGRHGGRLHQRLQHFRQELLLVDLELGELLEVLVLRLLQGDLAGLKGDHARRHGLLHPLLLGLGHQAAGLAAAGLIVRPAARRRARALAGRRRHCRRAALRQRRFDEGERRGGDGREARQNETSIHGVSPSLQAARHDGATTPGPLLPTERGPQRNGFSLTGTKALRPNPANAAAPRRLAPRRRGPRTTSLRRHLPLSSPGL